MALGRQLSAMTLALTVLAAGCGAATAGTLDDVRSSGTLRIAYRMDAPPFSYQKGDFPTPVGFMVDLCRAVASGIGRQLGLADLKIAYVPVTSADRFEAISGNKADLLCEATTQTLKRRETIGFSIPTYVDGASFIIRPSGPRDIKSMAGKKIGVLVNTTTESELRDALKAAGLTAEIVAAKNHQEGLDGVKNGTIAAYFADHGILAFLLMDAKTQVNLLLADTYLSVEPYALGLRRGDDDFRLAVDRALSEIYRSGQIRKIFGATFGASAQPSPSLVSLYITSALPP